MIINVFQMKLKVFICDNMYKIYVFRPCTTLVINWWGQYQFYSGTKNRNITV